ncbi:MAG: NINE protein [Phycisphaerales bacterium]|nr:NINE protein [Phycisphaerales bacterium]
MKTSGITFLCWLLCFVGFFGIHRFYNGKWVTGLLWFFTGGLLLIGQIVDLFLINSMTAQANRRIHSDFRRMQAG